MRFYLAVCAILLPCSTRIIRGSGGGQGAQVQETLKGNLEPGRGH